MAKIKTLRPMVATLRPRIAPAYRDEQERSRYRDETQSHRVWYKTARWQKLRWSTLVRDRFTCQMPGCGKLEPNTSQLVADHKTPHHGDEALFWDENNLQCLCKPCHDKLKQSLERRSL